MYLIFKLHDATPSRGIKSVTPSNTPMNVFRRMKESASASMSDESQNTTHDSTKRCVRVAAMASFRRINVLQHICIFVLLEL